MQMDFLNVDGTLKYLSFDSLKMGGGKKTEVLPIAEYLYYLDF